MCYSDLTGMPGSVSCFGEQSRSSVPAMVLVKLLTILVDLIIP